VEAPTAARLGVPNTFRRATARIHHDDVGVAQKAEHLTHRSALPRRGRRLAMLHGMDEPPATYSISVRLQRTTTEETYLSVPVDAAIMQDEPAPDGSSRIDPGKLWAQAIRLAEQSADWSVEDRQVSAHTDPEGAAVDRRVTAEAVVWRVNEARPVQPIMGW